jgi:hypothetical protein
VQNLHSENYKILFKEIKEGQVWWYLSTIPASQEVNVGGLSLRLAQTIVRPYLKNKLETKGLGM